MRTILSLLGVLVFVCPLAAQTLTMGNDVVPNANLTSDFTAARTDIDFVHPANATGNVSRASFSWSNTGCSNGVKIKFFRRNGDSITTIAVRGPFNTNTNQVTFSPVAVQQGDLIGITRVATCGGVLTFNTGSDTAGFATFEGDVTGTFDLNSARSGGSTMLAVFASGDATETVARVIPVVGSLTGSFGSNFKTSVQLFNPTGGTLTGKLVFHPDGVSGSAADPSVSYSLATTKVVSYPDIVAAAGRTGIGTMDVVVPAGQAAPLVVTRVFNDAASNGTSGFTEELIDPAVTGSGSRVLTGGTTSFLIVPIDPSKTRFNIGVRTLFEGAALTAYLRDKNGTIVKTVTKSYPATWYEQRPVSDFFGTVVAGDQSIQINVTSGAIIVYGSTTDNMTNDPAVQFATAQ